MGSQQALLALDSGSPDASDWRPVVACSARRDGPSEDTSMGRVTRQDRWPEQGPRAAGLVVEALVLVGGLSVPALALADDALRFELEPSCPGEEYFWAQVSSRLDGAEPKARLGEGGLRTAREGAAFTGRLQLEGMDERIVRGESCAEVMDALALIAVLRLKEVDERPESAIGPETATAQPEVVQANGTESAAEAPQSVPAPVPSSGADVLPPRVAPKPALAAAPERSDGAASASGSPPTLSATDSSSWADGEAWILGVGGLIVTGPAPKPILGVSASAERIWGGPLPFSLGGALEAGWSRTTETDVGDAKFRWWVARAAACLEAVGREPVGLWPCVELSGGVTEAIGLPGGDIREGSATLQGWAAGGANLTIRTEVVSDWFVDLGGGAALPAVRHTTLFRDPDQEVHRTDRVSFTGRFRLSYRLP